MLLFKNDQYVAFHYRIGAFNLDFLNNAVTFGVDVVFHLHGFQQDYALTSFNGVANVYEYVEDSAWQW